MVEFSLGEALEAEEISPGDVAREGVQVGFIEAPDKVLGIDST